MKFVSAIIFYYIDYWNKYTFVKATEIKETEFFRETKRQYSHYIINNIKERVLKKLENLQNIDVSIKVYDDENITHKFIYSVFNENINPTPEKKLSKNYVVIVVRQNQKTLFMGMV
jgi:hypothetical protein